MTSDSNEILGLKAQIQHYLVESGNYEKLSNELNQKLLQDGWVNEVRNMTIKEINNSNSTKYTEILEKVEPSAIDMVSDSTKEYVMQHLRSFLEEIVEAE